MHSSLAFRILRNSHNFLEGMPLSKCAYLSTFILLYRFLKFHALVTELIISTDMVWNVLFCQLTYLKAKHTTVLGEFKNKTSVEKLNLAAEEVAFQSLFLLSIQDRLLLLKMILKVADIRYLVMRYSLYSEIRSNPLRPWPVAEMWAKLVCEEFFQQVFFVLWYRTYIFRETKNCD